MHRYRSALVAPLALLTLVALGVDRPTGAAGQGVAEAGTSTLSDQVDLALTVYNGDLALVRDVRQVTLPSGISDLRFVDIAATVNPATVHVRSLSEPARLAVLEQNYQYDLLEPDKLLRKYVGRTVTLVRRRQGAAAGGEQEVQATLVSYNNGPIWKIGGEFVTGLQPDHVRVPDLPQNLHSRPTLIWSLENQGGPRHRLEASYLAEKLSWSADYVLTVGRDDRTADLNGWVTLTNGSGTSFRNATVQLVAGELNRAVAARRDAAAEVAQSMAAAPPPMLEQSFSEYHLYTVGRRTSVNNNETKQLALLSGTNVPVEKRFVVTGSPHVYRAALGRGVPQTTDVQVFYRFRNRAAGALGVPMPAGVVRVYQVDPGGSVQFIGEDAIGHTPIDERIDLRIGNAFDVACERNQVEYQKIGTSSHEAEIEVRLRNHKKQPVTVEVDEPIGGSWRMVRSTHKWEQTTAWTARFDVPVAAEGEETLRYRVRVDY